MKLVLLTVAQGAALDTFTNRLSIFNIIEAVQSPTFPVVLVPLTAVAWVRKEEGDPEDVDANLSLRLNETDLAGFPFRFNFAGLAMTRNLIEVGGFVVPTPGKLELVLSTLDQKVVGSWSIEVSAAGVAPPVASQGGDPTTANSSIKVTTTQ